MRPALSRVAALSSFSMAPLDSTCRQTCRGTDRSPTRSGPLVPHLHPLVRTESPISSPEVALPGLRVDENASIPWHGRYESGISASNALCFGRNVEEHISTVATQVQRFAAWTRHCVLVPDLALALSDLNHQAEDECPPIAPRQEDAPQTRCARDFVSDSCSS